jgi:ADP-ribose pyrophosphatase YjhB (NUDIX family)
MTVRVYLNNRYVFFPGVFHFDTCEGDFLIEPLSRKELKHAFLDFEASERINRLVVLDTLYPESPLLSSFHVNESLSQLPHHGVFRDFCSLFCLVEAAGGLVINEEMEPLLIYRKEHWDLPKGKIFSRTVGTRHYSSCKESPMEAALREVKEETGLKMVEIISQLPCTYHIYREKDKRILKKTWWFEMKASSDQSFIPQVEEDILKVQWIPRDQLEFIINNIWPSLQSLLRDAVYKGI